MRLKETKTAHGSRRIDLPNRAIEALNTHRQAMLKEGYLERPVFCDTQGGYLRKTNVLRRSFYPAIERAGLSGIRYHDLKHSHATHLLLQGTNPKIVSERLGHATINITLDSYSHVLPTMQKEAADLIDKLFA